VLDDLKTLQGEISVPFEILEDTRFIATRAEFIAGPDGGEVCMAAEKAYRAGKAPLAAVEGFIRQILGWREYVRGIYCRSTNSAIFFNATRPLPAFFWDETKTDMRCMRECIGTTRRNAYAHHIHA
jgi:deoxyribodipyrimidine photolyase-like uncharacterized protein